MADKVSSGTSGAEDEASALSNRAEIYAQWLQLLREDRDVPADVRAAAQPLDQLGQELDRLTQVLEERERRVHELLRIVHEVEKGFTVTDVLNHVFEAFRPLIPYDRIGCAFVTEDGARVQAFWARSDLGPIRLKAGYAQPLAGSTLAPILETGEPRILNDLPAHLAAKPQSHATRLIVAEGGCSSLTCPLRVEDRAIGFLFFTSSQRGAYSGAHTALFRLIAEQVSAVIEKSRAYERLIAANAQAVRDRERFQAEARSDPLTGLLNRRGLMAALEEIAETARVTGRPVAVIMTDIDRFKTINDRHGHEVGDVVLKAVAARLRAGVRKSDPLGRYGGEEFVLALPGTDTGDAAAIAEKLRAQVAGTAVEADGRTIAVTISLGVAAWDPDTPAETAIAQADAALYRAKEAGRNHCEVA
jgi:diguanylate cyclase (GGDEF)-like protein